MANDHRHVQIRLTREMKQDLENLSKRYEMTISDAIRTIIYFGLPVFTSLMDVQMELARRIAANLKKDARKESSVQGS